MICDALTKLGSKTFDERLVQTMTTGYFSFEPSPESTIRKMEAQKARMSKIIDAED